MGFQPGLLNIPAISLLGDKRRKILLRKPGHAEKPSIKKFQKITVTPQIIMAD
jgi:hypothetical protein